MINISRRSVLTATAAGGLAMAATAAQAQTGQTMPMPRRPGECGTDPGPRDALRDQEKP
jgi:oxalate decarboxylase